MWTLPVCNICVPGLFVRNFRIPSPKVLGRLSKITLPLTSASAVFSSSSFLKSQASGDDEYSNAVSKILDKYPLSLQQRKKYRKILIDYGVNFYLDKGCFKESADFFSNQAELYHGTQGLHLLLDYCLRSFREDITHLRSVANREEEKQKEGKGEESGQPQKFESAQKVCRDRIKMIREMSSKSMNTPAFIAHLIASMILNGFYKDAYIFMLSFSLNGQAFFDSLFLWKKQCDLASMEKFAEILEEAYFGGMKLAIEQGKRDNKEGGNRKNKKNKGKNENEEAGEESDVLDYAAEEPLVLEKNDSKKQKADTSGCEDEKAGGEPMKSYCTDIELDSLLGIWIQKFKKKKTHGWKSRICVKPHKVNNANFTLMINVFVNSWAGIADKRHDKDSLIKLRNFLQKNEIKPSEKYLCVKKVLAKSA